MDCQRLSLLVEHVPMRSRSLLLHPPPPVIVHLSNHVELRSSRSMNMAQLKSNHFHKKDQMVKGKLQRRLFLEFAGFISPIFFAVPAYPAPKPDTTGPEVIRTIKFADGVKLQEIIEGEGPEVHNGDLVEINYVCRRSNGYFVHSTVDQFSGESTPVLLPLDENKIIKGLKEVLIGMRVGGKRRALIPPSVGYVNEALEPIPTEFGPRRSLLSHASEPLIFEVQLLKVL